MSNQNLAFELSTDDNSNASTYSLAQYLEDK
jgi:hypothetical protein